MLLPYRMLFVADELALLESYRKTFRDTREALQAQLDTDLEKPGRRMMQVQIAPGRYRVSLPANYRQVLPAEKDLPESYIRLHPLG